MSADSHSPARGILLLMTVRVFSFGVLKDWLGAAEATIELPEGATVKDLLVRLSERRAAAMLRGIAVSVNAEYATADHLLHEGDEVGLLPPVSGGNGTEIEPSSEGTAKEVYIALTREPIDAQNLIAAAKQGEDGAVVVFDGIVRNNSRRRKTLYLDYEAYEEMAARQMNELAREARGRFAVRQVTMVHRLGRLHVGETSVLIVVASEHRAQAFEACRWLIDTLKKIVPIWKKETFQDGAVWADGEPFPAGIAVDASEPAHGS
ncbi:MAG: molybdenum cofactor biosynthesis protein MoaE [Terracidiphilus sp.]|jgi:molybdopterin synthase catalytic subunit